MKSAFAGALNESPHRVLAGIALMIASTVGFSIAHTMIRVASADMHPFQVAFFRNFFGMFLLSYWFVRHGFITLRTRRLKLHLLRVTFSAVSLVTFYYALSIAPLAKVTALGFITPIFVIILAALFLNERIGLHRAVAIGVGLCGALVVVRPGMLEVDLGTALMLVSALMFAGGLFCIKLLTRTDPTVTMTSYAVLLMTPITLIPAATVWRWPALSELPFLAALGFISVGSVLLFTSALKRAATHVVMPFDYLRLIWMAGLGFVLFAEVPDLYTWIGGSLIFVSALVVSVSEYRGRHARTPAGTEDGLPVAKDSVRDE